MHNKHVVIDACVFIALIYDEAYSKVAREKIQSLLENRTHLIVPDLFLYELLSVAKQRKDHVEEVLQYFRSFAQSSLTVVALSDEVARKASEISDMGHPKSGFPSIYDSVYHALAILLNTDFITADKRHYAKTQHLGHIQLITA